MRNSGIGRMGLVLVAVLMLPAMLFAQQNDRSRLISTKGPAEFWNLPYVNETPTNLIPTEVNAKDQTVFCVDKGRGQVDDLFAGNGPCHVTATIHGSWR